MAASTWLAPTPCVASGIVQSGARGCFRAAGCVDVVLNKHSELQLLAVSPAGKLEPVFSQHLFTAVRSLATLPFSMAQQPNTQTQVLDHLLLLLDSGSLMVLKYSQVVQRFYIAAEAQLAAGTNTDPDYLGACLAVSPQPTAAGDAVTVAVAAKRGRIACLTVQLAADGSVQLSSPVVYALPAPRVLGASYQLVKRDMELGDIIDFVLLPPGKQQQGQPAEHLAVLSHRPGEAASELVMFSWSGQHEQQLRKLGTVSVHNRAGALGLGVPLQLAHAPQCPSAVLIAREWGLMLLECSALMQQPKPGQQVERCYVECTQQLAFLYQEQLQAGQHWLRQHHLHCVAAKCVLPSLKQTLLTRRRPWQGAAVVPKSPTCTPAASRPADDAAVLTQAAAAAVAAAVQADAEQDWPAAAPFDAAGAGQEEVEGAGTPPATVYAGYGEEAAGLAAAEGFVAAAEGFAADAVEMAVDYPEQGLAYDDDQQGFDGNEGFEESEDRFLYVQGDSSSAEAAAAAAAGFDTSGTTSESGSGSEEEDEGQESSPLTRQQQQRRQQHGSAAWTPGSSQDIDVDRAVVEPTSITAVAWASSARDCSPAAAAAAPAAAAALTADSSQDSVAGPLTAAGSASAPAVAAAVTDQLLVSTSCGCLLQLRVSLSPSNSSMWTPTLFPAGANKLPFRSNNCISVTGMHKVFEVQLPTVSSRSCGSRMGPLLLPLPQRRLLVAADEQSQLLLLQQQQERQQHPQADAIASAAAAAGVLQQVQGDTPTAAAAADGMDIDAVMQPHAAAAAHVVHAVPSPRSHHRQTAGPGPTQAPAGGLGDAGQAPPLYVAADQLQLLGKVGPVVAFAAGQQQQQQQPLLVAARAGTDGGLRVLSEQGPSTTELLRGPAGMLEGASSMWPLAASPDSSSSSSSSRGHVALVFSFAAGATRALSVGEQFADVTEVLGLQGSEATLLAACVAEDVAAQVTPSGVRLCCLDALLSRSSSGGDWARAWRGSPKSSRSAAGWRQPQAQPPQQQQQPQQCLLQTDTAAAASSGGIRSAQHPSRLANSSGTAAGSAADAAMSGDGDAAAAVGGELANAAPAAQGPISGMPHASCSRPGSNSPSFGSPASESGEQQHWHLSDIQQQQQQQQRPAAVVLAAAAAGLVLLYTNTGRLVVLTVSSDLQHRQIRFQQQQHRALNLEPLDLNSDDNTAAAPAAGAEGACRLAPNSSNGSNGSGGCSKKRVRCSWGLFEAGSMQVDGQVSCLQVLAAPAAAAAGALPASPPGSSGSSSGCQHIVFVGRYDGSLQLLALHAGSGSLQPLVMLEQQQLLPLQHLAAVLRESGSGGTEDPLQLASVPVVVPESCVVLPGRQHNSHTGSCAAAGPAAAAAAGVRGAGKRGKSAAVAAAAAGGAGACAGAAGAAAGADDGSSGCLQFFVSYRTGAVAAYRLELQSLCHQQQQQKQQQQHAPSAILPVRAGDAPALQVVSQLWLPSIVKLQLLPRLEQQQQQVLAVGSQVWLLTHDAVRQLLTSSAVPSESQVLLAGGLSLPQAATGSAPGSSGSSGTCTGTSLPPPQQQQQQQQSSGHHIVMVTAGGQLQLLHVCSAQQHSGNRQSGSLHVSTWLPCTTVSHLLRHPSTNLLLAACRSLAGPGSDREGSASRDLGSGESVWLQALDPVTGARLAAYPLCRQSVGRYIMCVSTWETPWRPAAGAGKQGSSSAAEQAELSAAAAAPAGAAAGAGDVEMGQPAATAAVDGGGAEGRGWRRAGAGRWWQRLRHRRGQTGDADAHQGTTQQQQQHQHQQDGEGEQTPEQQQQQQARRGQHTAVGRAGRRAAAAAAGAADGSSSGSEHFFQLGSLLKGLDSPGSGPGVARTHSSGRSSQGTRAVKQRKGPLVLLGTEICGKMDGCNGQVLVLQLMHSSQRTSTSSTAAATAAVQTQRAKASGGATAAVAGSSASMQAGQEAAAAAAGAATDGTAGSAAAGGGSWSMQRVARLRMPDPVSALAAFGEDLLLVATHQVLALYCLKQNVLVKAAYCFTRAPILSLSPAPWAAGSSSSSSSSGRLVLAADSQMGVTVFQVCQVLCLPQELQPAAPAAAVRAAKLAEAASAPLPKAVSGQHAQPRQQHETTGADAGGTQQDEVAGGSSSGQPGAMAAAADVSAAEGLKQVQQLLEAGLRGLCLDENGAVVEVAWAKQRTVPAKWLHTAACIPLGGRAATGSLQLIGGGDGQELQQQQQQQRRLAELLPGHPPQQDGLPLHWLPAGSAAVMAAAAHGSVLRLQRLPAAEGLLLSALQAELMRHPLTRGMLLGAAARQAQQQQPAAAMVDARVFAALFCLPYPAQLLVLQSWAVSTGRWPQQPGNVQLLLDGLRSRLLCCLDGC